MEDAIRKYVRVGFLRPSSPISDAELPGERTFRRSQYQRDPIAVEHQLPSSSQSRPLLANRCRQALTAVELTRNETRSRRGRSGSDGVHFANARRVDIIILAVIKVQVTQIHALLYAGHRLDCNDNARVDVGVAVYEI